MKKKLIMFSLMLVCTLNLMACKDGVTTMDQGKDTDGRSGEPSHAEDSLMDDMDNKAEKAIDQTEKMTKEVIDSTKDAANRIAGN